jgi:glycosyltransferase involved in cell wall biosynthesis
VHHVAIKPVLYGSLVARLSGVTRVVNALGGMGSLFSQGGGGLRSLLKAGVLAGFRWLMGRRGSVVILQNPDDCELLVKSANVAVEHIRLIRGAGVNVTTFASSPEPDGVPLVVLPARMLADKGVPEFVEAARQLKREGVSARFALVGGTDPCNPAHIPDAQLARWAEEGDVEWFGRRDDMPAVFAASSLVCLPSYREGLPKSLLEAASCGRAIVTTDVPGCREVVRHGENGLLVPAADAKSLADALRTLLQDGVLRRQMGERGREMVLKEFSEESVVGQTLEIYRDLLPSEMKNAAPLAAQLQEHP